MMEGPKEILKTRMMILMTMMKCCIQSRRKELHRKQQLNAVQKGEK
jgi:hypothetical protein